MLYKAFISYSHAADGRLAPALQSALHRFARPWYRMRALRIFRDETNLSISPALWPTIAHALGQSEFFILLASPGAAASKWVAKEIAFWLQHRSIDTLLVVMTDGDILWDETKQDFDWDMTTCLPPSLTGVFKTVPHYLDFRWAKTSTQLSLKNPEFLGRIADLAATLHGRSKDEMIGEDVQQHRRTKRVSAGAIVSLLSLTAFALYQKSQAETQRSIAVGRQLAAQSELLHVQQGRLIERSTLLAIEATRRAPSFEANQALREALSLLPASSITFAHSDKVLFVALTPDGQHVVTAGYDGSLRAWDVRERRQAWTVASESTVLSLASSPDGLLLAAGFHEGSVRILESQTGHQVARFDHEGQVNLVLFSPDGKYLLTSCMDATARVWSVPDGHLVARLAHKGKILALGFASDSSLAITGSMDGTARVWMVPEGREVYRANANSPIVNIALSPDRRHLVTAGREPVLRMWNIGTKDQPLHLPMHAPAELLRFNPTGSILAAAGGSIIQLWETKGWQQTDRLRHEDQVTALLFDPMGRSLATASLDRTARVWNPVTGRELMQVAHDEAVQDLAYDADGRLLATASLDGMARVVESNVHAAGFESVMVGSAPLCLASSPDGSMLAIGREDGTVMLWDAQQHRLRWEIKLTDIIVHVAFSPDSRRLAIVPRHGPVKVVLVMDGREVVSIMQTSPRAAAFSPNGEFLALGGGDRMVRLWGTDAWREVHRLEHHDMVQSVAFSPDGHLLVVGTGSFSRQSTNEAILWNLETYHQEGVVSHESPVEAVAFSPEGSLFATGSQDFTAAVWRAKDRSQVIRVRHDLPVWAVQFSKDGRQFFTASEDRSVRVWDLATAEELNRAIHGGAVKDMLVSPDGETVITASIDGRVRFSLWKPEGLIKAACSRLTRNLTHEEWQRYLPKNDPYIKTCPLLP